MTNTHEEHTDVIIDRGGGGNSGMGVILGVILVLVVVGLIVWFAMFRGVRPSTTNIYNNNGAPAPSVVAPGSS